MVFYVFFLNDVNNKINFKGAFFPIKYLRKHFNMDLYEAIYAEKKRAYIYMYIYSKENVHS